MSELVVTSDPTLAIGMRAVAQVAAIAKERCEAKGWDDREAFDQLLVLLDDLSFVITQVQDAAEEDLRALEAEPEEAEEEAEDLDLGVVLE
jgi:hypothetical protein